MDTSKTNAWHPDSELLLKLVQEDHAPPADDPVVAHLHACQDCRLTLDKLLADNEATHLRDLLRMAQALQHLPTSDHVATTPRVPDDERIDPPAHYQIQEVLGRGGQAITYRAYDHRLQRVVVLKRYHSARDPATRERILAEGRAIARVHSDIVPRCYSAEMHQDEPWLVFEHVKGEDLHARHTVNPFSSEQALDLIAQIGQGLAEVHASAVLHLDLKPSNVLVAEDGKPRLIDFGLARLGGVGPNPFAGTPGFMAPEQASGETDRINVRTDVFGLGAILYFLLTGRPLYQGNGLKVLIEQAQRCQITPPREHNPRVLPFANDLCMRCLARDPSQRFSSVSEVVGQIRSWQRRKAQKRWRWAAAVLGILFILPGIWVYFSQVPQVGEPGSAPSGPSGNQTLDAKLAAIVYLNGVRQQQVDLTEVPGPLFNEDQVGIEVQTSPAAYTSVFWIDSQGKPSLLSPKPGEAQNPRSRLRLPSDEGNGYPVEGESGTELVVLIASQEPFDAEKLRSLLRPDQRLPALPRTTVVRDDVVVEARARDMLPGSPALALSVRGERGLGNPRPLKFPEEIEPIRRWRRRVGERLPPGALLRYLAIPHTSPFDAPHPARNLP